MTEDRQRVSGIGGVMFRVRDTALMSEWYRSRLGLEPEAAHPSPLWRQTGGSTAFSPVAEDSGYFGRPEQQVLVTFRVRDLEAMAAQLRRMGEVVDVAPEPYENGRYARLTDPEGNTVELWEPAGADADVEEGR